MVDFAGVLLRGIGLGGQAVAVGGLVFVLVVLRKPPTPAGEFARLRRRALVLAAAGAVGMAVAQALSIVLTLAVLARGRGWPLAALAPTLYFQASVARVLACAGLAAGCWRLGGSHRGRAWAVAVVSAAGLLATSALTSHAAARMADRGLLLSLDAIHEGAASIWVGGLLHLVVAAAGGGDRPWPEMWLRRFSSLALGAVMTFVAAGLAMASFYVDGLAALIGTAYGLMVMSKGMILVGILMLATMNFRVVRAGPASGESMRLRRFVEVELALGLTALLAAASLTSTPPAADVVADRATVAEVAARFTPQWPRLTSPALAELPIADRDVPRTAADRDWSEYNHHVAGLSVLAMGLLATMRRTRWGRWARHWPLIFLGLAVFLFFRDDPGAWPLGPEGFWASMTDSAVLQHRVFVLLVVAFGLFEWGVQTARHPTPHAALVFPLLVGIGCALLLLHSHAVSSLKAEFLIEVTHTPLALSGLMVGWGRWLALRLPPPENRLPERVWPLGLALVGLLLLLYRES